VIRRWWWLVAAAVLVASASSYYSVSRATRIYQATTTVIVGQSLEKANPTGQDFYISQQLAQTYINMIQRAPILQGAAVALDLEYTPSPGNVSARIVPGTQLVEISVRDSSPERARILADEVARQLILQTPTDTEEDRERRVFVQDQLQALERNIEQVQAEIAEEQARLDAASSARAIQQFQGNIAALQNKLGSYQTSYASLLNTIQGGTNYISVVEPARTPTSPVSPRVMETVALAAAIGLVLALGGAFLTEFLDDTVKSVDDTRRATDLSSLGAIPRIPGEEISDRLYALHHPRSGIAEAFRTLRTNIRFSAVDRPLGTIMITSADSSEGKSLILANLAVVMAQEGRSVILVDADLRRPRQHTLFQLANEQGLSDAVLAQDPHLATYCVRLSPERLTDPFGGDDEDHVQYAAMAGVGELRVLTSGPLPPNPADLLGSERLAAFLKRLSQEADIVLLDCPPVLAVTDAIVLARRVDGVLLLADLGSSRRGRIERAVEQLRQVEAPMLGFVANRASSRRHGYYYYQGYYEAQDRTDGSENGSQRRGSRQRRQKEKKRGALLRESRARRRDRAQRRSRSGLAGPTASSSRHNGKDTESVPLPAAWLVEDDRARPDARTTQQIRLPRRVSRDTPGQPGKGSEATD
jgi:Mrp family chromosome partitioning ATPase/capsular polysaccharide biosynthesis protein